ncbi:MAG: ABC transporter permease [Bacteroidota bacterium]
MPILHHLEETYQNLRQHQLRSVLTGFGVTWGIFMLVILLGIGEGFYKGVARQFEGYAQNSMQFWAGQRTAGDQIMFTAPLLDKLSKSVAGIKHTTPIVGGYQSSWLAYKGVDYNQALIKGVSYSYAQIGQLALEQGRFLNTRDEIFSRQVCVIGKQVQRVLFKTENPIGKFISVNGQCFQVVGTLVSGDALNQEEHKSVFVPFHTFYKTFNWGTEFWRFRASLRPGVNAQAVESDIRAYLAKQLHFDPANERTLYVYNLGKRAQEFHNLFRSIHLFLWIVGVCTLLGGAVSVSNMMLVGVKERTQEIGIRKVLGASHQEILLMILSESVFISLASGIVGMVAGIGGIQAINKLLDHVDPDKKLLIAYLEIPYSAIAASLALLVVVGAIAGLMPARKATSILPIKALNTE